MIPHGYCETIHIRLPDLNCHLFKDITFLLKKMAALLGEFWITCQVAYGSDDSERKNLATKPILPCYCEATKRSQWLTSGQRLIDEHHSHQQKTIFTKSNKASPHFTEYDESDASDIIS